jgi:hypothetical protein
MTNESLAEAIFFQKEIEKFERHNKNLLNERAEWIEFNFGNGGNAECVCSNKETIKEVAELIKKRNDESLELVKQKFAKL